MRDVPVSKNSEIEQPIPTIWRETISQIVCSFVNKDYENSTVIAGLEKLDQQTVNHIKDYIADYGEELVPLPEETWQTSVCLWADTHWDILVDLWTESEGQSDLVLKATVRESECNYLFNIEMVFVP